MSDPASLPPWHRVLPKPASYDEYPPPHAVAVSTTSTSDNQIHDQQSRSQEPSPASVFRRNSSFFPLPSATYSRHPYPHHLQQQRHPSVYDHQLQSDPPTRSALVEVSRRNTLATIPYPSLSASNQSTIISTPHPDSTTTNPLLHLSAVASAEQRRNQEAASIGDRGRARGSGSSSSLSPTAPAVGATARRPYLPPSISESALSHRLPSDSGSGEAEPNASGAGRKRSASLMAGIDEVGPCDAGSRDASPIHQQQRAAVGRTHSMSSIGGTGSGGGPPPQFCLCRTDPKIPRPRNGTSNNHSFMSVRCDSLFLVQLKLSTIPLCRFVGVY